MVKRSLIITIFGVFFHVLKNKLTKLVNFVTKNTVTIYPPTLYFFLGIVLVGMGIGINESAFMALKRVPSNKILHTLKQWAQYPSSLGEGYDGYEVPLCLLNSKCIREYFQVHFDMYSALPSPWAAFLTSALIHGEEHPTGVPHMTLDIKMG
jgi:hypothetical protein